MDKIFKFEIHQGKDYFDIRELCNTSNDVKYNTVVNPLAGKLILEQLQNIKIFIRQNQ